MEVEGTLLGPMIQVLLDRLVSLAVSYYGRREGIDRQLKKLEEMLSAIGAGLADAEEKQMTDDEVKLWMEDLSDLAYDLDDLLDEVDIKALRLTSTSKVRKLIPTCCTSLNPSSVKLVEFITRLGHIKTLKNLLNLIDNVGGIRSNTVRERRVTTSLVDESAVYGRDQDKEAIVEKLLRDEVSVDKFSVIPIVGMGGIGKTTLAQLVYNDARLWDRFDFKAWVCVSDDFDVIRVTKKILEAVTFETHYFDALDMIQQKLKEKLSGKRFLFVLDDVWNDKYEDWELLKRPFMNGAPGSKIIVTTRNETVASIMTQDLTLAYHLKQLSKDDCLSLFAHHALGRGNFDAHPYLKEIGEEIVNKCKGLPLAVKSTAGLLRSTSCQREWEAILNSKIWDLPEQRISVLPALKLSYNYLPSHLKPCFAYCATFPKGFVFEKDELVLLWMGVGLLQLSKEKKRMEDFGYECFDDLLSRSFFQQIGGNKSQFVMHDLLNDLAQQVAGDICFRLDKLEGDPQFEIPERTRHLSFIRQEFEVLQNFRPLYKVQHLRTFLPLLGTGRGYLANKVLLDLFPKTQRLRVLSLSGYAITKLPDSIGDLKHLRYLNLSGTSINQLPKSVRTLYNLQTLLLHSCKSLRMLPPNIGNLINLRHLDIVDTVQLREMSSGIGRLTNLQTLSKFIVGKNNGLGLKELKNLRLLRNSISITELQNVMDLQDANEANLRDKEDLNELELEWSTEFNDFRNENLELDVLDKLRPHEKLRRLKIMFYGGTNFPSWIGETSFYEMVKLTLVGCKNCKCLPPLGQLPMLKELRIQGMHEVKKLGDEFYGDCSSSGVAFASLKTLIFEDLPVWEEWSSSISSGLEEAGRKFPCLLELTIRCCPKLIMGSLLRLPSLHKLYLKECEEVVLKSIVDLTSLTSLEVENIIGLSQLEEALVALETLVIKKCNQLMALWQNEVPCINLEKLHISDCVNLEKLPNELKKLTSLTSLEMKRCSKLVCFPKTGVPPTLRKLEIEKCNELKSLPEGISGLEELKIESCSSLRSWPTESMLSTTLKFLLISDCMNLELMMLHQEEEFDNINISIMSSVQDLIIRNSPNIGMLLGCLNNFDSLRELDIRDCNVVDSLSFPERGLPNLRFLTVCRLNLRSLGTTDQILQKLTFLRIYKCSGLESIGLSTPNLRWLRITACEKLSSFPLDRIQSLESLESIHIYGCPFLESFPQDNFHLPPNLIDLRIGGCWKLKPFSEWSLHRLTSLQQLEIGGGYPELVSFPPDEEYCLLPTTLTTLRIQDLPKLKSIPSKALQNLTSLQHLSIFDCPKLQSLPKEGLPSTLQCLQINECPLEKRCSEEDRGDYWPKIARIPYVGIHGKLLNYYS